MTWECRVTGLTICLALPHIVVNSNGTAQAYVPRRATAGEGMEVVCKEGLRHRVGGGREREEGRQAGRQGWWWWGMAGQAQAVTSCAVDFSATATPLGDT